MKTVYLAGSIAGCDNGEANDWRKSMSASLRQHGIIGISPLRCEPIHGERYGLGYEDPKFGTARAIASKNRMDVQMCDMTLCYMPKALNERRFSMGTLIELAWAHMINKPTILVTDYSLLLDHPVVQANASWILGTLAEAEEVLVGVLGDYSGRVV
jgi:nucleoside 2-deoxyribosyltransferase